MTDSTASPLPRLDFDDLPLLAREAVRPRYERLGYLGEIFGLLGSNESTLVALLDFADGVGRTLDPVHKEIVALVVSAQARAESELFQHEQRALKIGMTRELVAAVESLDPEHAGLDAGQRAIVRLALAMTCGRWDDARDALARAVERFDASVAVALLMQSGYYLMATAVGHVLALTPPVPSIFAASPSDPRASRG